MESSNSGWHADTFLALLSTAERKALFKNHESTCFSDGEELLTQSAPQEHVFVIEHGFVKSFRRAHPEDKQALLAISGAGDLVGAESVSRPESSNTSHIASKKAIVKAVPVQRFERFVNGNPDVTKALILHLSALVNRRDAALAYSTHPVQQRLPPLLDKLSRRFGAQTPNGWEIDIGLSHHDLGAAIGASTEAVAKALRCLRDRGVLQVFPRRIVFPAPPPPRP